MVDKVTLTFADLGLDLVKEYTIKNKNSVDQKKMEISKQDSKEILSSVKNLEQTSQKIKRKIQQENKFLLEKVEEFTKVSFEFQNLVVDPYYKGNPYLAYLDLMKKALEKEKNEKN